MPQEPSEKPEALMRGFGKVVARCLSSVFFVLFVSTAMARQPAAQPQRDDDRREPIPVILDTDIGTDIDDTFALALMLASPELKLHGVTTVGENAQDRAWIVCRFLTAVGRGEVPVAWGRQPQPESNMRWQIQYRRHPAVIFNRTAQPVDEPAVEFLNRQFKQHPGELTLLTVGPLTNVARLIEKHPDCKSRIKWIVMMGGSVRVGYDGHRPPDAEWNIRSDAEAARKVMQAGIPLVVAPLDATTTVKLKEARRHELFAACTPVTMQIQALYQLWHRTTPTLYDPVAVALGFTERFCELEEMRLKVDEKGYTRPVEGKPNARVALSVQEEAFVDWIVSRLKSFGKTRLPEAPQNITQPVEQRGLPARIHAVEDYETALERRWWMAGRLETGDVPPGSTRCCRGVLTQDFDAKMGDTETMYTAVIFNPVPGPPMGSNTRLSFRYKLSGSDTLRVQIYSLSNGYHRYLALRGLPQNTWQQMTVDMRQARRPDGSGGPLSDDERIDDIQFYADPRAELFIDDIVLYEAAPESETRPFPKRVVFTGWFDTGKQGQEWPGDFTIIPHKKPRDWDAAQSIVDEKTGRSRLRVHLRGQRPLPAHVRLKFLYRLSKKSPMRLELRNSKSGRSFVAKINQPTLKSWTEATVDFPTHSGNDRRPARVDEIHFRLQNDAKLLIDDLLLYQPAKDP